MKTFLSIEKVIKISAVKEDKLESYITFINAVMQYGDYHEEC